MDENGVLTANAPGATTVTAVVDGAAAACCVAVSDGRPLQMSELVILDVGETVPLGGQLGGIEPELVRWVSRHPDVVRVDADGMATGVSEGWTYVTAVYDGRTAQCAVWVLDPANYIRVRRFDGSTTQQAAETALKDAGVSYTKKWVESTIAAGHISELLFTGYRDSDYYYISPNEPVELWISADAENTKEPEKEPEKQEPAKKESLSVSVLPDKRTFYSGDTLTTSGLKLQYTDKTGKTQTVSSGFQTTANMQAAGTKQGHRHLQGSDDLLFHHRQEAERQIAERADRGRHPPVCDDGSCRADSPVDLAESADRLFRGQRAPCSRCGHGHHQGQHGV